MSSALIRQALEFVDQDELKRDKRSKKRRLPAGQDQRQHFSGKVKKRSKEAAPQTVEDKIQKLLALSKPVADSELTEKIVKRAVKGKPLLEYIEVKKHEEEKSILFPEEESFKHFEEENFCS
ncbi:hypothetical protein JYU34_020734 [Plutella xylostella]|uniref:40S ribosomal protein S19-binding protein 1 n=1 Tax=Plutella xylostella TaxID=51655 RepID=A0ABQ7PWD0_PLUXY|nr:hypothetical protein JYU34_020734 [Plutella xylostella]